MYGTLEQAAQVARDNISIQRIVVKEEYLSRYVISHNGKSYRVIRESDLTPPKTPGLLPWVDPLRDGTIVGYVGLDGLLLPTTTD